MIFLKEGVKLHNPSTPAQTVSSVWSVALPVISAVFSANQYDCTITSAFDGTHKTGSLHYTGRALDFRTRHIPDDALNRRLRIAQQLRNALGNDFDVVLEDDHIHIEFQPKG